MYGKGLLQRIEIFPVCDDGDVQAVVSSHAHRRGISRLEEMADGFALKWFACKAADGSPCKEIVHGVHHNPFFPEIGARMRFAALYGDIIAHGMPYGNTEESPFHLLRRMI